MWQIHMWSVYPLLTLATAGLTLPFALLRQPERCSTWRRSRWDCLQSLSYCRLGLLLHLSLPCVEERALVTFQAGALLEKSAWLLPGGGWYPVGGIGASSLAPSASSAWALRLAPLALVAFPFDCSLWAIVLRWRHWLCQGLGMPIGLNDLVRGWSEALSVAKRCAELPVCLYPLFFFFESGSSCRGCP